MKRIAYAITGLLALALPFTGMAPAQAWTTPSTACSDGYATEVTLLDHPSPVYLAVEVVDIPSETVASVCYKDRSGLTSVGGFVSVVHYPAEQKLILWCEGDLPASVAISCLSYVDGATQDPDPSSPGSGVSGWIKVEGVTAIIPLTGAEVGGSPVDTTNGVYVDDGDTCVWVMGIDILPGCTGDLVSFYADVTPELVTSTTPMPSCAGVYLNNTCIGAWVDVPLPRAFVITDPGDQVYATFLGQPVVVDLDESCVGIFPGDDRCFTVEDE